jgi:hypothetical protein
MDDADDSLHEAIWRIQGIDLKGRVAIGIYDSQKNAVRETPLHYGSANQQGAGRGVRIQPGRDRGLAVKQDANSMQSKVKLPCAHTIA